MVGGVGSVRLHSLQSASRSSGLPPSAPSKMTVIPTAP